MFKAKGASLTDIWTALNAGVQALNNLTISLKSGIITGPQGIQGPAGSVGPGSFPRSYLAGLTLSNDGGSPNSVIDIAAGQATDSGNTTTINLSAFTKSTAGAWVLGTGNNGMGTALTVANNTWYHVFAGLATGGVADVYFDTSASGANAPGAFTVIRRIGSFLTDGSANIISFSQNGDNFLWSASVNDVNVTNQPNTAVLRALTVPTGVKVDALIRGNMTNATAGTGLIFTSPDESDQAVATGLLNVQNPVASVSTGWGMLTIRTDTSGQIRTRASANSTTLRIWTFGWNDSRGRFA